MFFSFSRREQYIEHPGLFTIVIIFNYKLQLIPWFIRCKNLDMLTALNNFILFQIFYLSYQLLTIAIEPFHFPSAPLSSPFNPYG